MKRPVIIDTDLTLDDAVALSAMAANREIDIKAVTAVGADVKTVNNMAKSLCKELGIECKTASGALKPVFKDEFDTVDIYGEVSLLNPILPCCEGDDEYPWDVISSEAQKARGQLEIITLGPLTNIAITLLRYPHIKPLIKRVFAVAGSGYVGNAAPYSEYNAFCDPDALQIVIDSGVPVTMCPLEAVQSCVLSSNEFADLTKSTPLLKKLGGIYSENKRLSAENETLIYSAAAMSAFICEDAAHKKDYYVKCETRSGENQGWTIIDRLGKYKKEPNVTVITEIDRERFIKTIK